MAAANEKRMKLGNGDLAAVHGALRDLQGCRAKLTAAHRSHRQLDLKVA